MPPALYDRYTFEGAIAAFGDPSRARFYCDSQFAAFPRAILCFATTGDPAEGTGLLGSSKLSWKPARAGEPAPGPEWFPARLSRCVERDGAWLPLHHVFLRAVGEAEYIYAGLAEVPMFGHLPEGGRVHIAVHLVLDHKLPRDLWLHLGGYQGALVTVNGVEHRLAADDAAGLMELLAAPPAGPTYLTVSMAGYEEHWFSAQFNERRAWLRFVQGGERRVRKEGLKCTALEAWDPVCPTPGRPESFGDDGHGEVTFPAGRTVPREAGVLAAVGHLRTGALPGGVRWRLRQMRG